MSARNNMDQHSDVLQQEVMKSTLTTTGSDNRVNILIVDDEPKNLTVLETVLEDSSYRLVRSLSADEALLALVLDEFALLILDVNLPGMSGFELAQMIKQRRKNAYVPIIFLTAYYNEDEHVLEGYGTGAVDYLHKPVNPVVLRSKVAVFVELYRKNRALMNEVARRRDIEAQLSRLNETLEQRIAERTIELRKSEDQFRQLADSMPHMVWTAQPSGHLDYYNARWHEFFGFEKSPGEIAGWGPLLHSDDVQLCVESWDSSVRSGEDYRSEFRLLDRHTQQYCWYLGRALPVRNDRGSIIRWIGTCTDIDDQKHSEARLRQANQALEQFAFAASHDLQEPLRNVSVFAELLRQRYGVALNEEANIFLGVIVEGSRRMSGLVSALLEYTQSAINGDKPSTVVDVEPVFERVLRNLAQSAQSSNASISRDTLPSVLMKEVHVEQLLQNLIGNALKYKRDDLPSNVHVSSLWRGNEWHFTVQDNGIGIAPEYWDKVFGVFKRLHSRSDKYPGTGIGLAICQKIIEGYGGRIWVESELGRGSTFHFTVPHVGL
ncbi:MAG TPA: ATP-binding protein [Bryobacteraceae bacterium]|nr:ATP-binding protein [Bryobacteraceae bacterium]